MLNEHSLSKYFWTEAVNTTCYIMNRILVRPLLTKTPNELQNNKKPNVSYFKVFAYKCFIFNEKDALGKFDAKSDEGILLGYSSISKEFRIINKRTLIIEQQKERIEIYGGEFQNHEFQEFCESNGYNHNLSTPKNPQQNRVVERKNRNL